MAIEGFRSRALKRLWFRQNVRGVSPEHLARIREILARLDQDDPLAALAAPRFGLHRLHGDRKGSWAVSVSGNWRITFRVDGSAVYDVDLVDYH